MKLKFFSRLTKLTAGDYLPKLSKLWDIDPGYVHLKHATKTLLSVLIVLGCMRNEPLFIKLITGIITGFSMQGIIATSFTSRILQIILLDIAYCIAFMLGLSVHTSTNGSAIVLVLLGFVANYLRRFGLQTSSAPFMGWCICFFATTLPLPDINEIWQHFPAILIALVVSGLANLLIFPQNFPRLFVNNTNRLFKLLSHGIRAIQPCMQAVTPKTVFNQLSFVRMHHHLTRLLANNQAIAQTIIITTHTEPLTAHLLHQNALVHAYTLITDAYRILLQYQQILPKAVQQELHTIYQQYAAVFARLRMQNDYHIVHATPALLLPNVAQVLNNLPLGQPRLVLVLLNLKLSFHLLNQQLENVLRTHDEA